MLFRSTIPLEPANRIVVVTVAAEGGNKTVTTTILFAGSNGSWEVTDPYLEVVSRLNNK